MNNTKHCTGCTKQIEDFIKLQLKHMDESERITHEQQISYLHRQFAYEHVLYFIRSLEEL